MRKLARLTIGIAAAAVALALVQPWQTERLDIGAEKAGAATAPAAPMAMPVPVAPVMRQPLPITLDYPARAEAVRDVTLQAKVAGFVQEQKVADGADVKEGDLLYRIDPRDFEAALDQAKAQLVRDEAQLDYLRSSLDRGTELAKSGYLAKDNFDQRTSAVRQAEAALVMDKAAIRTAELNLSYAEIRAPFAGRLGRDLAPVGTLVGTSVSTPLNSLVQLDPIYVTFNPSETDLGAIQKARASGDVDVDVTTPGAGSETHRGTLTFLDNSIDRATGTITARATIKNSDLGLLPGQYVRVSLHVGNEPEALMVPQAALGSSQLGKYVYVVGKDMKVEQRMVALGSASGDLVQILGGAGEGDKVITGNLQKIGPGMTVEPMEQGKK
jgi:membrane fusion protein, multidrug efflux system